MEQVGRGIYVNGNWIVLEQVSYISGFRQSTTTPPYPYFQLGYINGTVPILFQLYSSQRETMADLQTVVIVWSDIPLEELREKIIKIVNGN